MNNERAVEVYKALVSAGEKYDVGHIGGYAINSMRIEKGFRLWGAEVWKLEVFLNLKFSVYDIGTRIDRQHLMPERGSQKSGVI